jgi:hypothetical protein
MEKLESNGIIAYIDTGLKGSLQQMASTVAIDYVNGPGGRSGFTIRAVGENNGSCDSCGSGCSS